MKFTVYYTNGRIDEYSDERLVASKLFPGEKNILTIYSLQERKPRDGIWVNVDYYNISQLLQVPGHSARIPKIEDGFEIQIVDADELDDVQRVMAGGELVWLRIDEDTAVDVAKLHAMRHVLVDEDLTRDVYDKATEIWQAVQDSAVLVDVDESRKYVELAKRIGMDAETLRKAVEWSEANARAEEEDDQSDADYVESFHQMSDAIQEAKDQLHEKDSSAAPQVREDSGEVNPEVPGPGEDTPLDDAPAGLGLRSGNPPDFDDDEPFGPDEDI